MEELIEVEKILVLSTKHMPESEPDFGGVRVAPHEYGYIVFLMSNALDTRGVPEWMEPAVDLAYVKGCSYINFDKDGGENEDLPSWEW